jgi:hypothetical protein
MYPFLVKISAFKILGFGGILQNIGISFLFGFTLAAIQLLIGFVLLKGQKI